MAAPGTFDDLSAHIARRHDKLSARLRTIAAFAVQNPNDVALSTVSVLAKRIGVQPSAIVRFANDLGYGGFTEMQQVFRTRLVAPIDAELSRTHFAIAKREERAIRPAWRCSG